MNLDQAYLCEHLSYRPETGRFIWKLRRRGRDPNKDAGCKSLDGYFVIRVDGVLFKAHRLAWIMMTGEWPEEEIDHINGNKLDNRWTNLREATRSENARNMAGHKDSQSGLKGVTWDKSKNKWQAQIWCDGRQHYLGRYNHKTEAHQAYQKAATEMHGEFARFA